jgi:hypothetical protein
MKIRKKINYEFDAIQYTGLNYDDIVEFIKGDGQAWVCGKKIGLDTDYGRVYASKNDYIFKDEDCGVRVCKSRYFKHIYEVVKE